MVPKGVVRSGKLTNHSVHQSELQRVTLHGVNIALRGNSEAEEEVDRHCQKIWKI